MSAANDFETKSISDGEAIHKLGRIESKKDFYDRIETLLEGNCIQDMVARINECVFCEIRDMEEGKPYDSFEMRRYCGLRRAVQDLVRLYVHGVAPRHRDEWKLELGQILPWPVRPGGTTEIPNWQNYSASLEGH